MTVDDTTLGRMTEQHVAEIHPSLFTRVMQLPAGIRADMLEFLGATPVEDAQLEHMLNYINTMLQADRGLARTQNRLYDA